MGYSEDFKIHKMPTWVLPNTDPAFYDCESGSAIEQTAKVYYKVNELIKAYNAFIEVIDSKVIEQDKKIEDAISYMKEKLVETVSVLIAEAIANGEISVALEYEAENKALFLRVKDTKGAIE